MSHLSLSACSVSRSALSLSLSVCQTFCLKANLVLHVPEDFFAIRSTRSVPDNRVLRNSSEPVLKAQKSRSVKDGIINFSLLPKLFNDEMSDRKFYPLMSVTKVLCIYNMVENDSLQ